MAGQSVSGGAGAADEVQQLRDEVARLRAYKAAVGNNLDQMGLDLDAAREQGWVSKRAEIRASRREKKNAAQAVRWEEADSNRRWIREYRKEIGLPVDDPTPTPSEAAYRERIAEAKEKDTAIKLRNRSRRLSQELLLAAAIGKQYREATTADHSGHNVPGTDPAVELNYKPSDARSETSMSTTEAMARSFRNWANREKANRFRSRSHSPDTAIVSSRSDSPLANERDPSSRILGALGLIYGPEPEDESDSDFADDDDEDGLTSLTPSDISDQVKATVGAMLATAENATDNQGDWADKLAEYTVNILNTPSGADSAVKPVTNGPNPEGCANQESGRSRTVKKPSRGSKPSGFPTWYEINNGAKPERELKERLKNENPVPMNFGAAVKRGRKQKKQKKQKATLPKRSKPQSEKWSSRKPNRPAAPDQSTWDPTWWRVNTEDADDGIWADKPKEYKQPTDKMETGFVTWAEQERRFPYLDDQLRLHRVPTANSIIFDPATVDTHIWDPINRAVTEPKTGKREPLRLSPVTTLSLGRFLIDYVPSKDPPQLPDNPPVEEKKRPLSTVKYSMPESANKRRVASSGLGSGLLGGSNGGNNRVSFAPTETTKRNPTVYTNPTAAVASVHYPLKSPAAQSISKFQPDDRHDAQPYPSVGGFSAVSSLRAPPGPPTPYPGHVDTPTVALYKHAELDSVSEHDAEAATEAAPSEQERVKKLDDFIRGLHDGGDSSKNENGKRPAPHASLQPPSVKRAGVVRNWGKENVASRANAAKKEGVDLGLARKYGEEELKTAHPLLMSEYVAARTAVDRSAAYPTTAVHLTATARLETARSRLKAAVSGEPVPESPELKKARVAGGPGPKNAPWTQKNRPVSSLAKPKGAAGSGKKAVRFQVQHEGPSDGMRDGARRALGRFGATSRRRGSFGPFR
ncbi:hypothetical protein F5X98DRAFT_218250 [Xylaria grammica]|nr:hypothetical protein F5X98DRAFT_218250 [Xylaria grammica]